MTRLFGTVLCFGEILWDVLPSGEHLGGAPLNVAFHLHQTGVPVRIHSAVGSDARGQRALELLRSAGLALEGIVSHPSLPTGTAVVSLDAHGQASYRFPEPCAWDDIPLEASAAAAPRCVVFGTLALRRPENRQRLATFLHRHPQAFAVCDLNLRPPFDDLTPLLPLLRRTHLLKVNQDEATRLVGPGEPFDQARRLQERYGPPQILLTRGPKGALLRYHAQHYTVPAPSIRVVDTIGAGDAFTAGFLAGWLRSTEPRIWPPILERACRLGAFVASQSGAQPRHPPGLLD